MNSFYDGEGNNIVIESEMNASVLDYLTDAFSTAICIGDSVTEGVVTGFSSIQKHLSYPTRLAKMTGWTIENAGASGLTALQWWQQKFSGYNYSQYQVAIIELGLNNGLSDTLDVDVTGDDYTKYADTNTGGYCKIIEGIKAQNEKAFILLLISSNIAPVTAQVIKKIGEKYNLPVIDLTDRTYMNLLDNKFHGKLSSGNYDYTHMNIMGYLAKAKLVYLGIGEAINDNISVINNLLTSASSKG